MRFTTRSLTLVAGLWLCNGAFAGINGWSALGPYGGQVQRIVYAASAPSQAYMVSTAGFSASQDGGITWKTIPLAPQTYVQDVAVDPTDATRVYVVSESPPFLQMSTDAGATLSTVTSFPSTFYVASQVQTSSDGTLVCVSALLSVACSTDHAQTWGVRAAIPGPANGRIVKLLIDPTNASTFYASVVLSPTDSGMFVSHDGATTWQQTLATTDTALDLALAPGNPSTLWAARTATGVWSSTDGGVTWTASGAGQVGGAEAIAVSPSNPAVLYTGFFGNGVFASTNGGATWSNVSGNEGSGQIFTMAVSPAQPTTLLVGGTAGVWGSTTGGTTWANQNAGVIGTDVLSLTVDPKSDRIYMNLNPGGGGLYCIVSGAATVTALNNDALAQVGSIPGALDIRGILAQTGSPGALFASVYTGIAESLDGGNSWALLPTSAPLDVASSIASSPAAPSVLLATQTDGQLYRTSDGGNSWSAITAAIPANAYFAQMMFATSDPTIVYGAPQAIGPVVAGNTSTLYYGLYRSNDSGQTWSPANAGMQTAQIFGIAVDPTNAQLVYVSTGTGISQSVDGGNTWTQLAVYGSGPIALDPVHLQSLYVAAPPGIMRSVDGGTTWETITMPLITGQPAINALLVDPNRTSDLLIATDGAGVQRLTIAPDVDLQGPSTATSVVVGAAASYVYTVSNNGPYSASGVQVSLQLPASAQAISATSSAGTCTVNATTVTCSVGVLRTTAMATISLTAAASAAGAFQIMGTAQADQVDSNTANNSITTNATVTAAGSTGSAGGTGSTGGSGGAGAAASAASHGGGGVFSLTWLLGLGMLLAVKVARESFELHPV
jgi:uncharacterized repeat protein (TIGR01451 family)